MSISAVQITTPIGSIGAPPPVQIHKIHWRKTTRPGMPSTETAAAEAGNPEASVSPMSAPAVFRAISRRIPARARDYVATRATMSRAPASAMAFARNRSTRRRANA